MENTDEQLRELSRIIRGYLNNERRWSHFSDQNGTTRDAIMQIFIDCEGHINAEYIRNRVLNDINRELSEGEVAKFTDIEKSWNEWCYIKPYVERASNN